MTKRATTGRRQARQGGAPKRGRRQTSRAPTEVDITVGENIRNLRRERRMTLAELGDELGISHQQLQKYETGANRLSAGMVHATAEVFNVGIESLFDDGARAIAEGKSDPADELRSECFFIVNRTRSAKTLSQMAKVLKAIVSG